ncbi:AAA family ATPase [Mucilaginibacter sp. BT774]|uniref:AAA family ATPase n=1 Tax=Mucilaginibacter sp. BT774 TaxID=3062276 RepID=UPI002676D6C6|nr:AAA family ATPase [Mucilaginibacter sp. BT774]MDO3627279.1 AAA family ATPase [Mucilaginibacter sp. BT774]
MLEHNLPPDQCFVQSKGTANVSFETIEGLTIEPQTYTGADLYRLDAETIPTLISPIVPRKGVWALVGSSDTGKSMLLRQLAICVAKRTNFLGWDVSGEHWKVIYIATEDDNVSTSYLIKRQSTQIDDLENIRFHFESDNIPEYLEAQLSSELADLIIIDCWSDVFGQNLIDSALIRQVLNRYKAIATKYNCSIAFLHHTGKRTEKLEPSKNNILSGQGFEAKMRLVIELRTDLNDENIKHLCIVKGNYLGREFKNSSFVLNFDPQTFLFTNSNERVPFELLAVPVDTAQRKRRVQPHEIPNETHLIILSKVFKGNQKLKLGELNPKLSNHYDQQCNDGYTFGKERVAKFLSHLLEEGLIIKQGVDRSPNTFYTLLNDD